MNLLIAVTLSLAIFGRFWAGLLALQAGLRWAGLVPAGLPAGYPGPALGHCPCCGSRPAYCPCCGCRVGAGRSDHPAAVAAGVVVVGCDGGGGC